MQDQEGNGGITVTQVNSQRLMQLSRMFRGLEDPQGLTVGELIHELCELRGQPGSVGRQAERLLDDIIYDKDHRLDPANTMPEAVNAN